MGRPVLNRTYSAEISRRFQAATSRINAYLSSHARFILPQTKGRCKPFFCVFLKNKADFAVLQKSPFYTRRYALIWTDLFGIGKKTARYWKNLRKHVMLKVFRALGIIKTSHKTQYYGGGKVAVKVSSAFLYELQKYFEEKGGDPFSYGEPLLQKRANGEKYSLSDHVRAMIWAFLSNNRPWEPIGRRLDDIETLFFGYDIERIMNTPGEYFETQLRQMRCGNRAIHGQMASLHQNIETMQQIAAEFGSMDAFVTSKPIANIVQLLTGEYKLRWMGEALVWEYLRNVGIDGAKPDLHMKRFFGRLGFSIHSPEPATAPEVIEIVEKLHLQTGWERTKIDAYIWNFCAKGFTEICTEQPRCTLCPIHTHCVSNQKAARTESSLCGGNVQVEKLRQSAPIGNNLLLKKGSAWIVRRIKR